MKPVSKMVLQATSTPSNVIIFIRKEIGHENDKNSKKMTLEFIDSRIECPIHFICAAPMYFGFCFICFHIEI